MEAESLNIFKAELDRCWINKRVKGYRVQAGRGGCGYNKVRHALIEWESRIEGPNGHLLLVIHIPEW